MINTLKDCVHELLAQADECKNKQANGNDYDAGRMQGLCEALGILKAEFMGESEIESLLDFDIDKRYLG